MDRTVDHQACAAARAAMVDIRRGQYALLTQIHTLDTHGVVAASGYRALRRLVEDLLHVTPADARRLVTHAALLLPRTALTGETLPPTLPATAHAAAAGLIGDDHLQIIATTIDTLSRIPAVDPDAFAAAETELAEHATHLTPVGLQKVATRLLALLDPDGAAPDDREQIDNEVHLLRRRDGSLRGTIRLAAGADAETVIEVFDRLSGPAGPDDTRTLAARRAEALTDLCTTALSPTGIATDEPGNSEPGNSEPGNSDTGYDPGHDTDGGTSDDPSDRDPGNPDPGTPDSGDPDSGDPGSDDDRSADSERCASTGPDSDSGQQGQRDEPDTDTDIDTDTDTDPLDQPDPSDQPGPRVTRPVGRALLTITIDHQWLQNQTGHGLLDSGHTTSPTEARRLACDAGIIPMVLGSRSEPLDVGRMSYSVPEAIRRALIVRDRGCTFPGCPRRPGRCHAHHIHHWLDGGDTDLDNLVLLCRYHHHLIHHGHWTVQIVRGRPEYRPPPYIDPDQRPLAA